MFFVCYIGRYDILSQQIRQIKAYHRKNYCDFSIQRCYSSQQKNHFCQTKLQTIIIKVVLSKFLYLIANWTSYPKPIKEALAILKSPLKLLIASFYNGQQLAFLENQIIFFKVHSAPWLHGNKLAF